MLKAADECVQHHPKNALEAWQRVIPFDVSAPPDSYKDSWRMENAYAGLKHGAVPKGSVVQDTSVIHPGSIREQFTINRLTEMIPDEKTAHDKACVEVYDEHLSKKERELRSTPCGRFQECTSVNSKGEFASAQGLAKQAFQKERKGQVVRGYCLNGLQTRKSNVQNAHHFSEENQLLRDRITDLEDRVAKYEQQPQRKLDPCAGTTTPK
jgi:hypothetical protein